MFEILRSVRLRRLFLGETLILMLVAMLMVRLRIRWGFEPQDVPGSDNWPYWMEVFFAGITIPPAVQLGMYYGGLYDRRGVQTGPQLLVRLALAHLLAGVALALLYYLVPRFRAQRLALGMALLISCWLLFSLRHHMAELLRAGTWRRQVLILGTGQLARWLGRQVLVHPATGYELAGFAAEQPGLEGKVLEGRPVLGSMADVQELVRRHRVDEVVFAPDERRGCAETVSKLVGVKLGGTTVWSAPQFAEHLLHCLPLELLTPSAIVFDPGFQQSPLSMALKRALDVVVSLVALILAAPILLLTALAIRLESPGPILYRQKRVGRGGRVFTIYKFRSMRVQAPGEAERLTQKNDDRITRVGRFIRLHRIDEIPQFFNVLRGDMSLVGPRPEVVYSVEELRRTVPFYDQRHAIRPGITSLGQVRFGAAVTPEEARQRLQYDLYYQKNMSMVFDLSILIDTVKVVLLRFGAR
ncbi:MAG: sugar transferase [Myxococcales bacterium]|nr:sugar transferase [Myxococcota bacterium]MDW8281245.1 sugar transferase [Myxococcales bacterium]